MAALDNLETLPDQVTITAMARLKCDEKISEVLKYFDKPSPFCMQLGSKSKYACPFYIKKPTRDVVQYMIYFCALRLPL